MILPAYLALFPLVSASIGDQLDEFVRCVDACAQKTCSVPRQQTPDDNEFLVLEFQQMPLPMSLRLLLWDCESNCDYQCQDVINTIRKRNDEELYQFHGKWFFVRYFNIQEPALSIFLFLNLISHYLGLQMLNAESLKLRKLNLINNLKYVDGLISLFEDYKIMCKIAMCAWICSTVFHFRDLDLTEKLDYFFAGATVLSGLYVATVRLFKLYEGSQTRRNLLRVVLGGVYVCHVIRLLWDWSYTYNMQINVLWAVIQYGQWAIFSLLAYRKYSQYLFKRDFTKKQYIEEHSLDHNSWKMQFLRYQPNWENTKCLAPIGLSIWVSLGLVFELFDFPPWRDILDAHSLWHLTTIIPGYIWYYWMVWDGAKLREQVL